MLNLIDLYLRESSAIIATVDRTKIQEITNIIITAFKTEKTIYAMGNGGNAGFVANLVNDFNFLPFSNDDKSKKSAPRNKFKAVSLCDSGATLTGVANDFGYDNIFIEQLKYSINSEDVLIGFSGSGNSKNVFKAFEYGTQHKTKNILITRSMPNKISTVSDAVICIEGCSQFPGQVGGNNNNFHFEDFTSKLSHIICGILKNHVQTNT
jgi:D-sedoheptulose 7-phosphate isomerase